jgi:hypothetical protein
MRDTNLVSPGVLSNGFQLRREAAKAISTVEILASKTPGGKTAQAARLSAFFTSCLSALAGFVDTVAETVSSRVRTAANTATVTFTGALDPSTSVPLTAFVVQATGGGAIRPTTAVVVTGSTIVVTATGAIATDVITYTAPATLYVRDAAQNKIANFTGALA